MLTGTLNNLLETVCKRHEWQTINSDNNGCFKLTLDGITVELFTQGNLLLMDSPILTLDTDLEQRWQQLNKALQLMLINPDIARFSSYCNKQKDQLRIFNVVPSEALDVAHFEASLTAFVDAVEWINNQLLN
ncbi:type III secretion system chaperone [Thalassomonas viridans]|uniref:Type III secretion system chaperone n=1 Tax=Thalassomonas viridans TaxID=137584 RepID=A0AAE9Z8C6_9GAMM|nr:CesT family type III secretion system chaperone [Thalassomonas viridans]WDE08635.1 type III secretion system chaperone [Thalassomonas viridans]